MICHGDEMGRTQGGNNNVYCQDNEISWVNWDLSEQDNDLLEFTRTMMWLRRDHPVLRRRRFFTGDARHGGGSELGEIEWLTPAGESMTDQDWTTWYARAMMVFLNGEAIAEPDERGQRIVDDSFLVLINASDEDITFTLPGEGYATTWKVALDTAPAVDGDSDRLFLPAQAEELAGGIPGARRETISSLHGHDGFLIEAEQMDAILRDFLAGAS